MSDTGIAIIVFVILMLGILITMGVFTYRIYRNYFSSRSFPIQNNIKPIKKSTIHPILNDVGWILMVLAAIATIYSIFK